ncbi:glycerophosphodiester phosphodiesterase family protein [Celeribacter neptunius]|uniref:Glycerophosphoryl diester phosphodiesterase n=1 Tax=Celeribacter neptunius TaxID=588602 RepID=A0A1I3WYE1_9RHOB|nr:glycerophosphodiester phosphodiesterase family protein [Celeribacter neptunius]SFK12334.1 Glycerophosphoryl diester phosphodiesterase [Celeribacter neptunius]
MPQLPEAFLKAPIAHRALHDGNVTRVENNIAAIDAAIAAGFGIEIDLQLSADGVAMVFHDYSLNRLTEGSGPFAQRNLTELSELRFKTGERGVPSFAEVLELVDGRAPLLVEVKDQDGAMGPNIGALEHAAAQAVAGYQGPLAFMSFNPHSVARLAELCPEIPRGITTASWEGIDEKLIPAPRRAELKGISDFDRVGATFISHQWDDLTAPRVAELKAAGAHILCWTVKSAEDERVARDIAENITFEGYLPT